MKNLSIPTDADSIRNRIAALQSTDQRRWGAMNAAQMVCHLADAFAGPLGQHPMPPHNASRPPVPRGMYKWLALNVPVKWPQGVATIPTMDQQIGGTPPATFATDRSRLFTCLDAFVSFAGPWPSHPIFGAMNASEWMRWGYLHTDHHLRQFGR